MIAKSLMGRALMATFVLLGGVTTARAQSLEISEAVVPVAWPASAPSTAIAEARQPASWSAPALRISLASAFVGLQALDTATTLHGVRTGRAVEANPLVGGLASRPAAFIAVKSGLTAATVASVHRLSRKHPKGAAIAMIALNAGIAFVVRSNVQIAMTR